MLLNNFTLAYGRHGVAHLISPSLGPIRCYVKACNTKLRALGSNERQVPPGPGKSGNRKGSRPERNSAVSALIRLYSVPVINVQINNKCSGFTNDVLLI